MNNEVLNTIKQLNPLSVFLYGSRASGDFRSNSDYEIGLIFKDADYIPRHEVHARVNFDGARVYPFRLSDIENGTPDTPFPQKFYMRELIEFGRTLHGEKIIEDLPKPSITTVDLLGQIRFEIGLAYGAFRSMRSLNQDAADYSFFKSSIYGARCLIMLQDRQFVTGYRNTFEEATKLVKNDDYRAVLRAAIDYREGRVQTIEPNLIYKNMSFLTWIEAEIQKQYDRDGDRVLVQ